MLGAEVVQQLFHLRRIFADVSKGDLSYVSGEGMECVLAVR